jgi:hypothetical protein
MFDRDQMPYDISAKAFAHHPLSSVIGVRDKLEPDDFIRRSAVKHEDNVNKT